MKKKREPTLHEKAIRLLEGGRVEINGNYFKAERLVETDNGIPCWYCNVDCRCQSEVDEMCNYLDSFGKGTYVLNLLA